MLGGFRRYMEAKHGPAKDYPRREVTEEEFIRLMMATGVTHPKAKLQATVAKGLGSACLVGEG